MTFSLPSSSWLLKLPILSLCSTSIYQKVCELMFSERSQSAIQTREVITFLHNSLHFTLSLHFTPSLLSGILHWSIVKYSMNSPVWNRWCLFFDQAFQVLVPRLQEQKDIICQRTHWTLSIKQTIKHGWQRMKVSRFCFVVYLQLLFLFVDLFINSFGELFRTADVVLLLLYMWVYRASRFFPVDVSVGISDNFDMFFLISWLNKRSWCFLSELFVERRFFYIVWSQVIISILLNFCSIALNNTVLKSTRCHIN